jgi:hypothetical protein
MLRRNRIVAGLAVAAALSVMAPSTAFAHGDSLAGCGTVSARVVRRGVVRAVVRLANRDSEGVDRGVYDYDLISGTIVVQNRAGTTLGLKYVSATVVEGGSEQKVVRIRYYPRKATPRRIGFAHCHHSG